MKYRGKIETIDGNKFVEKIDKLYEELGNSSFANVKYVYRKDRLGKYFGNN